MKPLFLITLICTFLFSCQQETEVVEETYPNNNPHKVAIYKGAGNTKEKLQETEYYQDGKVKMKGGLKNNKRHGKWEYYYPSGNMWSICYYNEGAKQGETVVYYENGIKRYEGEYANDTKSGTWRFFSERGELLKEEKFYP